MSGTTTVEPETGQTEVDPQQRKSKRLLGLEQSIPLDNLNLPVQGPPLLTGHRGRNNPQRNPTPGKSKGPVRFGEAGSLLMKPFSTARARSNSAGSGRAEGRNQEAQGGSLSHQEGFGGAKLKGRTKSPASSVDATPKRERSPSPTQRQLQRKLDELRTTTDGIRPPEPLPPAGTKLPPPRPDPPSTGIPGADKVDPNNPANWDYLAGGRPSHLTGGGGPFPGSYAEERMGPGLPTNPPPYSNQGMVTQTPANPYEGVMDQISGMPDWKDTMRILKKPEHTNERTLLEKSLNGALTLPNALTASKASERAVPNLQGDQPRTEVTHSQGGTLTRQATEVPASVGGTSKEAMVPSGRSFSNFVENIDVDNQSTPEAKPGRRFPGGFRLGANGTLIPGTPGVDAKGAPLPGAGSREDLESFHTAYNDSEESSEAVKKLSSYLAQIMNSRAKTPTTPSYWNSLSRKPGSNERRVLNLVDQRFEQDTNCIIPNCPELAAGPRGLCLNCLAREQLSGSFIAPKEGQRDNPLLGGLKREILSDKINHHASLKNLSAQRSVILLKEIRLFSQAVNYSGGGDAPQLVIQSQCAMHNLRNPPDLHLEGTPVVQRLGLRNAVRLTDQVTQVEDINWVIELHKGVVEGRIRPRPIDSSSWYLLKDDSLQSWFGRLRVL